MAQEIPAYLQSEEAFKGVASYAQRKALVQGKERKFGVSGTYTGETHQNLALIRYLQDNPRARQEWERQLGITRAQLDGLRQEYETQKKPGFWGRLFGRGEERRVQEASRGNDYFKREKRTDAEMNAQGGRAVEASERERIFMDVNNLLVKAWRADIGNQMITGGLLGMLFSRTSNLNKALKKIESQYGTNFKNSVVQGLQTHFANVDGLSKAYAAYNEDGAGHEVLMSFLSPLGFERNATLRKIQSDPNFTGRLGAFLQVVIGAGISAAITGSPSIYLGSINTGIKMKDIRNPNKDVIARALFNESYNTLLRDNDREHGRYNRMLGDNGLTAGNRGRVQEYSTSLRGTAGEYEEAVDEGYKATGGWALFRVLKEVFSETDREIITNPNTPIEKKLATIDESLAELSEKRQTDNIRAQIAHLQRLKTLYSRREQMRDHETRGTLPSQYHEALRIMNRFTEYDDFKSFLIPSYTKQWMKRYVEGGDGYRARDPRLLTYLWDSNDTPGFRNFISAYSSGKINAYNQSVLKEEGRQSTRGTKEYGRDISNINTNSELSEYLNSSEPRQGRLASIYAAKLNQLTRNRVHVDPETIVRAARSAQFDRAGLLNSGLGSNDINRLKTYNGNGWLMDVPATFTGDGYVQQVLLRIGVKPNCSNLLIGNIVGGRFYDSTNLASDLNFRIPLAISLAQRGGGGGRRGGNNGGGNNGGGNNGGGGRTFSGDSVPGSSGETVVPGPQTHPGISGNFDSAPLIQQPVSLAPGITVLPTNPAGI